MPECASCHNELYNFGEIDNYIHANRSDDGEIHPSTLDSKTGCETPILFKEYDPIIELNNYPNLAEYQNKNLSKYGLTRQEFDSLEKSTKPGDHEEWTRIRKLIHNDWSVDSTNKALVSKIDTSLYDPKRKDIRFK